MNLLLQIGSRGARIVEKRLDGSDSAVSFSLEDLRDRLIEVWSFKSKATGAPEWLSSTDAMLAHFESVLGHALETGDDEAEPSSAKSAALPENEDEAADLTAAVQADEAVAEDASPSWSDIFEVSAGPAEGESVPFMIRFEPGFIDIPAIFAA